MRSRAVVPIFLAPIKAIGIARDQKVQCRVRARRFYRAVWLRGMPSQLGVCNFEIELDIAPEVYRISVGAALVFAARFILESVKIYENKCGLKYRDVECVCARVDVRC